MQHLIRKAGATSQIIPISVYDSSSTVGAKLAGLVYNTASLTAYYNIIGAAGAATAIALATATKGTWASSGFIAIDGTNMPGDYELHVPDAAIAAGAAGVSIQLKGAADMVPVNIYIELTTFDLQTATQKVDVETIKTQAVTCAAAVTVRADVGAATIVPTNTQFEARTLAAADYTIVSDLGTVQSGDSYALANGATGFVAIDTVVDAIKVKTDYLPSATAGAAGGLFIAGSNAATSANITGNITGNLSGTVGSVTGAVGSVTGAVGSITGVTFPTNFGVLSISVTTGLVDITQTAADKAWGTAARVLTAGTNIALAKGTGVTGFNDLDAAGIATATWNAATVTYGSAGSYGLLIETNLDAAVSTRSSHTAANVVTALGTGATLSAIPWNASWDAEVESEVTDSLVAHNLDHLCLTATAAADMTAELADNTILSRVIACGDTSAFEATTDCVRSIAVAVSNIAVTGTALNAVADGRTLTAGDEGATVYTSTYFVNEVYHVITAAASTIDIEYLFTLPTAAGVPTNIEISGYLREGVPVGGDSVSLSAWNYLTSGWDVIDPICFVGITTAGPNRTESHILLPAHVNSADKTMRIRIYSNALEAGTTFNADQVLVSYAEAVSASIALILADTGELQTDWANGGRLDVILDATSTHNAAAVAALVLVTPAQKLVTDASGRAASNVLSINNITLGGVGTTLSPWGPA